MSSSIDIYVEYNAGLEPRDLSSGMRYDPVCCEEFRIQTPESCLFPVTGPAREQGTSCFERVFVAFYFWSSLTARHEPLLCHVFTAPEAVVAVGRSVQNLYNNVAAK